METDRFSHLKKLMDFLARHFLAKNSWSDVTKTEWEMIVSELNLLLEEFQRKKKLARASAPFGANYLYEHIIINKLNAAKNSKKEIRKPNLNKLSLIVQLFGYSNFIDFINSYTETHNFNDLKIEIPSAKLNTRILDELTGFWYAYNRNLPEGVETQQKDRIWRSSLEIYRSGTTGDYLVERSGADNHKYYGKITAYGDYVFIIMNSNTFIRQRHFISRLRDINEKLKQPGYKIPELHFISTCISFNQEPIALFEIFQKTKNDTDFNGQSLSFPVNSKELPASVVSLLKDKSMNRIQYR